MDYISTNVPHENRLSCQLLWMKNKETDFKPLPIQAGLRESKNSGLTPSGCVYIKPLYHYTTLVFIVCVIIYVCLGL